MHPLRVRRAIPRRGLASAATTLLALLGAVGVVAGRSTEQATTQRSSVVATIMADREVDQAARRTAAPAVAWDLPNLDHVYVDRWVARFTGDLQPSLEAGLARMERYDEMIAEKAAEHGVPQDLMYLALIESNGNPTATSPVGARGLWQFMTGTARDYGLTSRERTDPEKSTDAAFAYLSDLHDRFGSWYLAAAAYNTGQGRVARILREETGRTRGTDADFYRIAKRLPKETRDYVPKLVAAARVAKEPAKYGLAVKRARGSDTSSVRG